MNRNFKQKKCPPQSKESIILKEVKIRQKMKEKETENTTAKHHTESCILVVNEIKSQQNAVLT